MTFSNSVGNFQRAPTLIHGHVNVIYLSTKHQRALGTRSKVSVRSRSNWNLVMLVFVEGGKSENPEKNPRSRDENQQQTQPTYDAESGNQNPGHIGGRRVLSPLRNPCSHHAAAVATVCSGYLY